MKPTFLIQEKEVSATHAQLVVEPLENGYGHTIGNALRRVMLSSLPGAAFTAVRIEGVEHQFTSLDGMKEDVVEMIMNLKQVRIKADSDQEGVCRLIVKKDQEITAADIECEAGFEIVNPDQYIATLEKGGELNMELTVEAGVGYEVAEQKKNRAIGLIKIDALYSPVVKVSYKVEATRIGRRTDYDKLLMDVTTDGTINPKQAMEQAAAILAKQFTQVFDPVIPERKQEEPKLSPEEAETLRLTVEELDLPTRIANALRRGGYKNVGSLVEATKEDIGKVKNIGEKSISLVNSALQEKGVSLQD